MRDIWKLKYPMCKLKIWKMSSVSWWENPNKKTPLSNIHALLIFFFIYKKDIIFFFKVIWKHYILNLSWIVGTFLFVQYILQKAYIFHRKTTFDSLNEKFWVAEEAHRLPTLSFAKEQSSSSTCSSWFWSQFVACLTAWVWASACTGATRPWTDASAMARAS